MNTDVGVGPSGIDQKDRGHSPDERSQLLVDSARRGGASPERLCVLFTMDCQSPARRVRREARPKTWNVSARAIEGFCNRVLAAGHPLTLFVTPTCAAEQAPLLEEFSALGVEVGLFLNPYDLDGNRYRSYLGHYERGQQREIVDLALRQFQDALGRRPRSARSCEYSASDDTFGLLRDAGFGQVSLSSPGRNIGKYRAQWAGASADPHYVDPANRLRAGMTPLLEVPVTTDAGQARGGISPELCVDVGTARDWHLPLVDGQLHRMREEGVTFKTLCAYARNAFAYHDETDQVCKNLRDLIQYVDALSDQYEVVSTTLSGAHELYRASSAPALRERTH